MWVATYPQYTTINENNVSIRATRVGGDLAALVLYMVQPVSIHATRVGGDGKYPEYEKWMQQFLSTPPVWVATLQGYLRPFHPESFYPRHPCGWRRLFSYNFLTVSSFYPRHPCGWRPDAHGHQTSGQAVSIHATRVGGDA